MKKKHIYLHIGTTKTGTSSVQKFLIDNQEMLKQYNFAASTPKYPHRLRTLIENIFNAARNGLPCFTDKQQQWFDDLIEKLKNEEADNIILSEELFWNIISYHQETPFFEDFINSLKEFSDITVIVYLRRQDSFLMSAYQQRLKGGGMQGKECQEWILISERPRTGITNFRKNLEYLEPLFGRNNIIVRPFEREQFVNQSLFDDFMQLVGLKMSEKFEIKNKKKNPGLSPFMVEIFRYLSVYCHSREDILPFLGKENKSNNKLFNQNRQHKFLSPKERIAIVQSCEEDNEWIARKFLGRADGVLFREPLPNINDPWEKYSLNPEEVKSFFAEADFLDEKQKEIMQEYVLKGLSIQKWLALKFHLIEIIKYSPFFFIPRIIRRHYKRLVASFADNSGGQA